jgi:two-component system response regulator HydG
MIMTAHGSVKTAVEAMQAGAFDFIEKPFPADLLKTKLERCIEVRQQRRAAGRLERENAYLREELRGAPPGHDPLARLVGEAEPMQRLKKLIARVAPTDSTVHVFGESGTGKELVASAIHELSPRRDGPFVKVNCGAIQDTLLESELFGHEKGAFTDAVKRRVGRFELADGGTLFLDEIGDITPAMQVKLLRVLQERTFDRVGGEKPVTVDVRVITATNKDLQAEVAAGRFREDLYYRLSIIPLHLPSLRERRADIPQLAQHFLARLARRTRSRATGFRDEALAALQSYSWPGNVRELENVVEQVLVFAEDPLIGVKDLPGHILGGARSDSLAIPEGERSLPELLDDLERQLILRAYERAGGVKTETARLLGIKTPALYYKLEKYGIGEIQSRTVSES